MSGKASMPALAWALMMALTVILGAVPMWAQLNRGVVEGVVTDPQGAVIPGVKVTVTSVATNVITPATTNSTGYYRVVDLVPGEYRVHFEAAGFSPLDMVNVVVSPAQVTKVDGQMKLGQATQRVEVTAQVALLETSPSNASTSVEPQSIHELPLQGRDIQQLVYLIPGASNAAGPPGSNFGFNSQFGTFPDPTYVQGSDVTVNGGQGGANAWILDGSVNQSTFAENIAVNPSPDAVETFQVVSNGFAPEWGQTGGGVFNVVLKSGTNAFHGDLYGYLRNSSLNARNPFTSLNALGQRIPDRRLQYEDVGGTFGGPIVIPHVYNGKNRSFFFVSIDKTILHLNGSGIFSVPTTRMKNGDFSEDPSSVQNGIWDPFSTVGPAANGTFQRTALGTPVPGNPFGADGCLNSSVEAGAAGGFATCNFSTQIPASMMDPVAKFFINTFPAPNFNDPNSNCPMGKEGFKICNNFLGPIASSQNPWNISVKVDHQQSEKNKFFAEFLFNPGKYDIFKTPWEGATFPSVGFGGPIPADFANTLATVGNTYILSPTMVNQFRLTFSRQYYNSHPTQGSFPDSVSQLSEVEKLLAPSQIFLGPSVAAPSFTVRMPTGGGTASFGPVGFINMVRAGEAYTILDDVTDTLGKHTLKWGFMFRLFHDGRLITDPTQLDFNGRLVKDPTTGLGGFGLEQFMLGALTPDNSQTGLTGQPYERWRNWGFYIQDDWRLKPNFTLNLGLRYDIQGWFKTRQQPMSNFCLFCPNSQTGLIGKLVFSGDPELPKGDLFSPNWGDVGPRLNFSWAPFADRKTVIRGGYDLFYTNATNALNNNGQGVAPGPQWQTFNPWSGSINPGVCAPFFGQCVPWALSNTTTDKATLTQPAIPPDRLSPAQNRDPSLGAASLQFYAPVLHDPMMQQWSLDIQRELPFDMLLDVGYVGTHGTHLAGDTFRNFNFVSTADKLKFKNALNSSVPITDFFSGQTATLLEQTYGSSTLPLAILLEPYPFFGAFGGLSGFGIFSQAVFDGSSIYHGLNVKLQKRYSHGLNFILAYTWSKTITNASTFQLASQLFDPFHAGRAGNIGGRVGAQGVSFASGFSGVFGGGYQDPNNRNADRTIAIDDIPQNFNLAGSYELPFGAGKPFLNQKGILDRIVGGWRLSGTFNAESGTPLRITGPCDELTCRPNLVGNPRAFGGSRTRAQEEAQFLNPAAFTPVFGTDPNFAANFDPNDPRAWLFGTAGLYLPGARSPHFWNLDAALSKDFSISETGRLEFRWELFNALNHQNLGLPDTNYCLPPGPNGETDLVRQSGCSFGKITNVATDPRAMQFSLKYTF